MDQDHFGHSYLDGVCVASLMDFNGDGVQDFFVLYSNGKMDEIAEDDFDLRIYELPSKDTYEFEIWTYEDGGLSRLLHEPSVSLCYTYPNNRDGFFQKYYQNFITIFENKDGLPVIQLYDESDGGRKYTNIYYSDGRMVRDTLLYDGETIRINGLEAAGPDWSGQAAGYDKILLSALLADSHQSSQHLLEGYEIDYADTLAQTEQVIRYLSRKDAEPVMHEFHTMEAGYLSLYMQELERMNRIYLGAEFIANHYYCLYDMDQDGVPELILYEGSSGAGAHYHFYTVVDGALAHCGDYGRTSLHVDGEGGLIAYYGRMNGYQIDKIELEGGAISITGIADGMAQGSYPELEDFGYRNYEMLLYCPPSMPLAFYAYGRPQ